jgi:colanic acid/amylovoran biosynthesis glycosyltransferase
MNKETRLALISPSFNAYSETFIKAHKEQLSFKTFHYYGRDTYFPIFLDNKGAINSGFLVRLQRLIVKTLFSFGQKPQSKSFYTKAQKQNLAYSFKINEIDVVLAEYGPTGAVCTDVCKENNIPLVVHFHGLDASIESLVNKYHDLYKAMFAYAASIIVVSQSMHNKLVALGAPVDKLVLSTYGPNNIFYSNKPLFDAQQLLSVGRFVDKKAPYLTILAFKRVLNCYPKATLKMIGDGPLLNTCVNLAKSEGMEGAVIFEGVKTPEEIRLEMERSCAFVQHSVVALNGDMEGTPVSIIEASAAGLPVIATKHAGIPDVIINGKSGILVNELDLGAMADAMLQLLSNPVLAKTMGDAGRENIRNNFSMEKHITTLDRVISKAVR